jgi:hypothetical protein
MSSNRKYAGGIVKYRGVEYQVVQTIVGGFRWSVQFGKQEKSGLLSRRDSAIMHVKCLIDARTERFSKPKQALAIR